MRPSDQNQVKTPELPLNLSMGSTIRLLRFRPQGLPEKKCSGPAAKRTKSTFGETHRDIAWCLKQHCASRTLQQQRRGNTLKTCCRWRESCCSQAENRKLRAIQTEFMHQSMILFQVCPPTLPHNPG